MLQNIAKEHKVLSPDLHSLIPFSSMHDVIQDIDYIIWTGDIPPHDIWNQTKQGNLELLRLGVKEMMDAFPGVPIFPALGNHESVPAGT